MEWSFPEENERYRTSLVEGDGSVSLTSVTRDGEPVDIPETIILDSGKTGMVTIKVGGQDKQAYVARTGDTWWIHFEGRIHEVLFHEQGRKTSVNEGSLKAPMPGTVLQVVVNEGQRVREGQHLMTLEAMKMEHKVLASKNGEISRVYFSEGDRVDMGSSLVEIDD